MYEFMTANIGKQKKNEEYFLDALSLAFNYESQ